MKLIHTADLHIGSLMKHLPAEKAKRRRNELLDTFKRLSEYAKSNGVYGILIAGDLFDENKVQNSVKNEVIEIISKFNTVKYFYVAGNHDQRLLADEENGLPDNLYLFSSKDWNSYQLDDNVTVTGIDTYNMIGKGFYSKLNLDKDKFNIVLMHGDATPYDGREGEEVIYLNQLKSKNIDYLALGHIHNFSSSPQKLDERGVYHYAGCLEGRGFDECGQKGFYLLDIQDKKLKSFNFVPFARRSIEEISVDITGCDTYQQIEEAAISKLSGIDKDNIIKVTLTGKYKAGVNKDIDRLSDNLNKIYFYCKVVDQSSLEIDPRDYENDISLRGQFIRLVMAQDIDQNLKEQIIDYGIKALTGEDIII